MVGLEVVFLENRRKNWHDRLMGSPPGNCRWSCSTIIASRKNIAQRIPHQFETHEISMMYCDKNLYGLILSSCGVTMPTAQSYCHNANSALCPQLQKRRGFSPVAASCSCGCVTVIWGPLVAASRSCRCGCVTVHWVPLVAASCSCMQLRMRHNHLGAPCGGKPQLHAAAGASQYIGFPWVPLGGKPLILTSPRRSRPRCPPHSRLPRPPAPLASAQQGFGQVKLERLLCASSL